MRRNNLFVALIVLAVVFPSTYLSAVFVDSSYLTAFWSQMHTVFIFDYCITLIFAFAFNLNRVVFRAAGFNEMIKLTIVDFAVFIFNVLYRLFLQDPIVIRWRFCGKTWIAL